MHHRDERNARRGGNQYADDPFFEPVEKAVQHGQVLIGALMSSLLARTMHWTLWHFAPAVSPPSQSPARGAGGDPERPLVP
jgi:hypothetical protein